MKKYQNRKKNQSRKKHLVMKKYLALALALVCISALAGCGTEEQYSSEDGLSAPVSDAAEKLTPQGQQDDFSQDSMQQGEGQQGDFGQDGVQQGEGQQNSFSQEGMQQGEGQQGDFRQDSMQQDNAPAAETAEYTYGELYLSVELPEGWDYNIKTAEDLAREDGLMICAIDFWAEEYPETVFELGYMASFGICATGVTIEEFTLSNGLGGHRYTEMIEDTLWLTITLKKPGEDIAHGTYCIMASPKLSVWEAVEPEFEKILDSVEVGSLPGEIPQI